MYEAVYEFKIKSADFDTLEKNWKILASCMTSQPKGALSSYLYFCSETGTAIIHSLS